MANEISKKLLKNDELEKQYEVTIESSFISSKLDEEAEKMQKTYKVDGFRPGKVPLEVLKKREGAALFLRIAERMMNDEVFNIVDQEKFKLSSRPEVNIKAFKEQENVVFEVIYSLLPEVKDVDLKKIEIESYKITVKDVDVENAVDKILNNFKQWKTVEKNCEIGDSLKIDFDGSVNGEAFAGGKAENFQLELGSKTFIDNFEEQLVGKKANDETVVTVKFPDDYHSSALAGKKADFKVKVLEVLEKEKEELNDEFVLKNFGVETVEKFKNEIRKELEISNSNAVKNKIKDTLFDKLIEKFSFALPVKLVDAQFEEMKNVQEKENLRNKITEPVDEKELRKKAERSIKLALILAHIGKKADLSVSENEINSAIMKNAMQMKGYEQMIIDFYRKNQEAIRSLKEELLEGKIIDYVLENISKKEKEITVEELNKL